MIYIIKKLFASKAMAPASRVGEVKQYCEDWLQRHIGINLPALAVQSCAVMN
jgi:hypothetical protein